MTGDTAQLDSITLSEVREQWPKSDDGRICARLLLRYGFTLLVESAVGAECTELRAQAESGASKALARIVKDFGMLTVAPAERPKKAPMQKLHRFQKEDPKPENDEK